MIPDFQTLMLPLLKIISNGNEYYLNDVVNILSGQFKITDEERKQLLPSGQTFVFGSRVGWAKTYLKKAGLLDSPKRGYIQISERGKKVLSENLHEINVGYLKQFPEFVEFQTVKKENNNTPAVIVKAEIERYQTPEEQIENGYQNIRQSLEEEILLKLKSVHPSFFERIVIDLLVKMGYGGSIQDAGKAIGKAGDEGIDGIIKEDRLGLDVIYIQAKRWEGVVGRPEIQKFVGALAGQGAKKGIFITTSSFTKDAEQYTPKNETKIVLIDGAKLASLMIDFNLGVSTQNVYEIKRIDSDYFEEE